MSALGRGRLLVLCVDRDNDIGTKAKVQTPVIGRELCLQAAMKLAITDPEEADANSIFGAIKLFDELLTKGHESEVAVIAGLFERGFEADSKLRDEMRKVLSSFNAEGAILVSDGVEDREVAILLQNVLPIVSIKNIVIKHSRSVEESYAILGRYLRMLVYDPRYSKFFLGLPGILIFLAVVLFYLGQVREAVLFSLGIVGVSFIVVGFGLDKRVMTLTRLKPSEYIRLFSAFAGILVILVGFFDAFVNQVAPTSQYSAVVNNPVLILGHGPYLFGRLLSGAINLVWIGLGLNFGGAILFHRLRRSVKVLRDGVGLAILGLLYLPIREFSLILTGQGGAITLIIYLLIGLAVTFLVVTVAYQYLRSHRRLPLEG